MNCCILCLKFLLGHSCFTMLCKFLLCMQPNESVLGIHMWKWKCQSLQSCPTLCNPMDCSPPGSSVHGILSGSILEWVVIPFSRGSAWHRDWTRSPALQVDSLPSEPPEKPRYTYIPCFVLFFYFSFRSIFRDRDGPRDCHTEWSKSEREKQISWINTYTWNLENGTDKPICKADAETDRVNCCILYLKHTQTNYLGMLLLWGNRELKRNSLLFKSLS